MGETKHPYTCQGQTKLEFRGSTQRKLSSLFIAVKQQQQKKQHCHLIELDKRKPNKPSLFYILTC